MEELIKVLKNIESDDSITSVESSDNPLIKKVDRLACSHLINPTSTKVPFHLIQKMKEFGYDVFPGEKDSFGWLTGCIRTNKGIIYFG
jgi:hypothetical protein